MGTAVREVNHALRRLMRSPTFTGAATLTLSIAIGATASVFGLVDGVLLKAFPYREPNRVMAIWASNPARHLPQFPLSAADYLDYRTQNTVFMALAAETYLDLTVTGKQEPERLAAVAVTPNYFPVLGLTPVLGRSLGSDSGGPTEVVISHEYWERALGGLRSVLGQTLLLDNQPYVIVGVMPAGLPPTAPIAGAADIWVRLDFSGKDEINRRKHFLGVYGRLKPGQTPEMARRDLDMLQQRLATSFPQTDAGWSVLAVSLPDQLIGGVRTGLMLLLSAAMCVLLIGAANLANLFLARFLARHNEMALRVALGATRRRLVGELIAETALVGLAAGVLGLSIAVAGVHALRALAPSTLPRLQTVGVDGRVAVICALMSVMTVFVFGGLPAWRVSRGDLATGLREGDHGTGSIRQHRIQDGLVVIQVAVATVLLTGAGLLVAGFAHLRRADLGFRPEGVLTGVVALSNNSYPTPDRQDLFMKRVVQKLKSLPGVLNASVSTAVPSIVNYHFAFTIIGDPPPDSSDIPSADLVCASADYFRTMGITLQRGRGILSSDGRGTQQVVVADELLAQRYFPNRDPIGARLFVPPDTVQIVGVVGSVKQGGLAIDKQPELYAPFPQCPSAYAFLAVRAAGNPNALVGEVRTGISALDKSVPLSDMQTMDERLARSVAITRFSSFLASLFAAVALALATLGVYSILAYLVAERKREIAVRMALGARLGTVVRSVLYHALILTGAGIAIGLFGAWILTRALATFFLGINPHDPALFIGVAGAFGIVALAAASMPAWRASRIDPVRALASS